MKYSMFIGRWQPWHDGHRWLIDQRLNEGKNVLICVREVSKDDKNPYDPSDVKKNVEKELKDFIKDYIVSNQIYRKYRNESKLKGQLAGDSVQDIIKSIGSRFVSGEIKNTKRDGKTYIKLKDEKFGSGVVKILKSRFGIDAKVDYYGGKGKVASSPSVSFFSDTIIDESINEGKIPQPIQNLIDDMVKNKIQRRRI